MTDDTGLPDGADAPHTTYLGTLLADLTRLVGEVEQMVADAHRSAPDDAAELAAQQGAIVAAAHEEAAAVLAAAHRAAALVLERAARGHPTPNDASPAASEPARAVVDLRDPTPTATPVEPAARDLPPSPLPPAAHEPTDLTPASPTTGDGREGDLHASLAAAIDLARGLSERIEQLSRDLHDSPAS